MFDRYLVNLELNEPATLEQILQEEKELNLKLPKEYIDFLLHTNGI